MDIYDLAALMKEIGNFDMGTFEGRLSFQKTVQILQSFGIDLGYNYNWYLRGPYCPDLAKDGFELNNVIDQIPKLAIAFADDLIQSHYDDFKKFMADKKDDPDKLEIASSLCFLRNEGCMDKHKALQLTEGKRNHFTMDMCENVWGELESYGVVKS